MEKNATDIAKFAMKQRYIKHALNDYLSRSDEQRPKYARLRQALAEAIHDGLWDVGEFLPNERTLTKITPFSLGTVQRSIKALVEEGALTRIKGKGTYVNGQQPRSIAKPFFHARFIDDSGEGLLPVYPRVVSKCFIEDKGPWSALLNQKNHNIFRIERILSIDNEFEMVSHFYINGEKFREFVQKSDAELTSGNYKLMLARSYNLPPIQYEQVMELAPLPSHITSLLGLPEGALGCTFRATARTSPHMALYYHEIFIPPNARQLLLPDMVLPTGR